MKKALELGRRGDPSPNPHVGCVVVGGDALLGSGYHVAAGEAHAETMALEEAGARAAGSDLYVTLEPCNHHGKTPPCTDAIIRAGISKVVVGTVDPNPHVTGGGIARLRAAGLDVEMSPLRDECEALIRPWKGFILGGRSYLTLKMAVSLDGRIAAKTGASKWISGEESRARSHRLRATHDAVLVGVSTVVADDPQLTVREGPPACNPIRVVVDSRLRIPLSSQLVKTAEQLPTCVITTPSSSAKVGTDLEALGVNVIRVPANTQGRCDMSAALTALAEREVVSVLCEGGAELAGSLLADELPQELHLFIAPLLLGPRGRSCALDWSGPDSPQAAPRVESPRWETLGPDAYLTGLLHYPPKA